MKNAKYILYSLVIVLSINLISCGSLNTLNLQTGQPEVTMSEKAQPDVDKYTWIQEVQISESSFNEQVSRDLAIKKLAEMAKQKGAQFVYIYYVDSSRNSNSFWTKITTVLKANLYTKNLKKE